MKLNAEKLRYSLKVLILTLISLGLHWLSITFYAASHATRQMNIDLVAESIISLCLLTLWIRYYPSKLIWLKSLIAIAALFLHWILIPTY